MSGELTITTEQVDDFPVLIAQMELCQRLRVQLRASRSLPRPGEPLNGAGEARRTGGEARPFQVSLARQLVGSRDGAWGEKPWFCYT